MPARIGEMSAGPIPAAASGELDAGRVRWGVLLLLFFAAVINLIDRQAIGLVKQPVSAEFGWSERDYANVISAFLLAYAVGLGAMGRLTDRLGVKRGLSVAVVVWSLAECAHGMVHSTLGFLFCRFGLGFGEGGNFPASVKAAGLWFPARERALAVGLFNTGSSVGAMVAPLFVPWIAVAYGWRAAFFATGSLGFVWLAVWLLRYHEPQDQPVLSARKRDDIGLSANRPTRISFTTLIRWRATWAFVVVAGLTLPVWFFYLFWAPAFFQRNHGLSLKGLGVPLMIVYLLSDAGSIAGGAFSSLLVRRGLQPMKARKLAMLASVLLALPVILAPGLSRLWVVTLIIGCAAAAHQSFAANIWTLVTETVPERAVASVFGFGAMVGSLASIGMAQATGFVLHSTGSYAVLFWMVPAMYLIALGALQVLLPDTGRAA
jgi:ACS family hexuronate transporter-like MFS transporter